MYKQPFQRLYCNYPKLLYCIIFYSFFYSSKIYAQQLFPGDIAVLGVNTNMFQCNGVSGGDEISFVCFKDIQTGTSIDLTDNGWERCHPNRWADREGVLRFTRTGSMIPAGTIITWQLSATGGWGSYTFISPDSDWLIENINLSVALPTPLNLNAGGDQLWFLFGGTWENSQFPSDNQAQYLGGTVLFGLNTKSTWSPICTGPTATQNSAIHPQAAACNSIVQTSSSDYAKYTGDMSPSHQLTWINRIHNTANWTQYSSCQEYHQSIPNLNALSLDVLPIPAELSVDNHHICEGESVKIEVTLPNLGGPFDVIMNLNDTTHSFLLIEDGYTFQISPDSNLILSISSVSDALGCTISGNDNPDIKIHLHSADTVLLETLSCVEKDSIYKKDHNQYGCDSLHIEYFKTATNPISVSSIDSSDYHGFAISCYSGEDGYVKINSNGGFPPLKTEWIDGFQGNTRNNLTAGHYFFFVIDSLECVSNGAVHLHAPKHIQTDFLIKNTSCEGSNDAIIHVKNTSGGVAPYLYQLNQNGFSFDSVWNNLAAQTISITTQDANGCEDSTFIEIEEGNHLDTLAFIDTLMNIGQNFNYILPFEVDSFKVSDFQEQVTFGAPNTLIFKSVVGNIFQGIVYFKNACPTFFKVRIRINSTLPIFTPNVIHTSASSSQKSNFSIGFDKKHVKSIQFLRIYDRFGALIFEETDEPIHEGWDGKISNKKAPTGVYIWEVVLELWNGELEHISGDLLLIP